MGKKKSHIRMMIETVGYRREAFFTDWFDFADYCKQANLRGEAVHIYSWVYVDG